MADANSPLNIDPANIGTLVGTFRAIFNKMLQTIDGVLPAKVIAYDKVTNLAQVKPQIMVLTTNGERVSRANVAAVPVLQLGAGSYVLVFDIQPGSTGWLIANDRDISLYLQSGQEATPNSQRVKSFSDAFFIPDVINNYEVAEEDAGGVVLQNKNTLQKIAINSNRVKIAHTAKIEIDAPTCEIIASTIAKITSPLLRVEGEITASGNITPNVP